MKVSVRLDDISPLIQYTGAWRAGSQEDALFSRYSDGGTFMLTQSNDAFATIRFPGTRISVFGAKRGNHNDFTVAVDSDPKEVYSGHANGDEEFQVPLFTSAVLPGSTHKLVVQDASTNADQPFLDIDYVEIEAEIEGSDSLRIETDAPFWTYNPPSSWDVASAHAESNSSSSHLTTKAGSSATISFSGTAVDLYGLVCSQCGTYWVSLDGGPVETFNAFNAAWTQSQTLLYMARDLEDAKHTLTVTNLGYPAGAALTLDYVTVYGNDPKVIIRSVAKTKSNEAVRTLAAVLGGLLAAVLLLCFFCSAVAVTGPSRFQQRRRAAQHRRRCEFRRRRLKQRIHQRGQVTACQASVRVAVGTSLSRPSRVSRVSADSESHPGPIREIANG